MNAWKNSLFCFVFKRQTELSWLLHLSKQRPIVVRENICMMETKGKYSRGGCKGNRQGMVMGNWLLTKYKDRYLKKCQNEIHDFVQLKIRKYILQRKKTSVFRSLKIPEDILNYFSAWLQNRPTHTCVLQSRWHDAILQHLLAFI